MSYCPECAYEFGKDVTVCPDCLALLVDRLPGRVGSAVAPDSNWVNVCRLGNDFTSELVRGLLDSNNIPSIFVATALQQLGSGGGGVATTKNSADDEEIVMVPREFQEEAELLLTAMLGDELDFLDAPQR